MRSERYVRHMAHFTRRSLLHLVAAFDLDLPLTAQVTDAGPDTSLCVNFHTMQGSALPAGATGFWALVSGCGTIVNAGSPTTDLNSLCIGTNVFVWYVDDNGTISADQVAITVFDASMAVVDAGPDTITVIAPQSSAFLSGSPTPIYPATCWWSWVQGSGVVVDPNDPNTSVGGLTIGGNILLWTCDNGPCGTTSDTLVIQMMLATSLSHAAGHGTQTIVYDPINQQIRVREAAVLDALDVLGMDGRVLLHAGDGFRSISTAGLPEGVYLARAKLNGRREVLRFVVGG